MATDKKSDSTLEIVEKVFKKSNSKLSSDEVDDILGEDSDFDFGRKLSSEFIERLGVEKSPQGLLNGVLLSDKSLNKEDFEELIITEIMQQTPTLQKAVYKGDLSDSENVVDYLMQQPHVMSRLNQRILSNEDSPNSHLNMNSGSAFEDIEDVKVNINLNKLYYFDLKDLIFRPFQNLETSI